MEWTENEMENEQSMIKIGSVLQLERFNGDKKEKYRCKVVESTDTNIYIDYPINIETNRTVFLVNGAQLNASFIKNEQSAFSFKSQVIGREKKEIPMMVLSYPGDDKLIKIQRREFVRVDATLDISIQMDNPFECKFATITEDISAGGTAIIIPGNIEIIQGMTGHILIVLPLQNGEYNYVKLLASIVRTWEKDHRTIGSVQFLDLGEKERQMILRYCFEKQVAMRKKRIRP
jgi:c-di-GMP-binding flagellar brake protein YcgR